MKEFKDSTGQVWEIRISAGTLKRLLEAKFPDIGKPDEGDPPLITKWDLDIAFKVDLIHEVLRPKCQELGIEPLEFADRLEGEALARANNAFLEEWANFCRPLRPDLARVIEESQGFARKVMETRIGKMDSQQFQEAKEKMLGSLGAAIDDALAVADEKVRGSLQDRLGSSASDSPGSPDASPSREPSAS